jgi:hypothetical protein
MTPAAIHHRPRCSRQPCQTSQAPPISKERRQGEQENGPGDRHGGRVSSPLVMMALRRSSRRQNIRRVHRAAPGPPPCQSRGSSQGQGDAPAGSGQTASGEAVGVRRCRCAGPSASAGDRPLGNWFNQELWKDDGGGVATDRPSSAGSPSAMPSIRPRAAAGAPSVAVSRLGSRAVGISCPTAARKLAAPMPATPGRCPVVASLMAAVSPSQPIIRPVRAYTLCLR